MAILVLLGDVSAEKYTALGLATVEQIGAHGP